MQRELPKKYGDESKTLFVCKKCNYTSNADFNASINILNAIGLSPKPLNIPRLLESF